jgi:hypothetical protein
MNDWWQENKRFAVLVASGAIVFVIGLMLIDRFFAQELKSRQAALSSVQRKLANDPLFTSEQLATLQKENAELSQAVETLRGSVAFVARPAFRFDAKKGAAGNQYFQVVSTVREELLTLAGRANLRIPEELGLPALSPTREPDIERYLEGFDLVDRAVRMAIGTGVERVDRIDIKLDPRLSSREGVGAVERTRVEMALSGEPGPLVQFLVASQSAKDGGPLVIEKCEMQPARTKADEAGLEVTFLVVRLHETASSATP